MSSQSEKNLGRDSLPSDTQQDARQQGPQHHSVSAREDPIESKDWSKLAALNYKPFLLHNLVLVGTVLINLGWIVWLAVVYTQPFWHGPNFILDGGFSGYVSTLTKYFVIAQVFAIGKITPYRNMRWSEGRNAKNTIDSDYWPYEWTFLRFRAWRNNDYFFQMMDIAAYLFTGAVVQFESNLMKQSYNLSPPYEFLGFTPNRGIIIIALLCHCAFVVMYVAILIWLNAKETGLLTDPGSLAFYFAVFNHGDIRKDFRDLEDEDRRWCVRSHLSQNQYRIGYWRKGSHAVYEIRRDELSAALNDGRTPRRTNNYSRRKPMVYPEFRYVPWFLQTFWITIWMSVLASSLAILSTLVIRDSIINRGFNPHVSIKISPFVQLSPASFLWSFFPSFVADLLRTLVKSIDTFYRLTQPYADLKRRTASKDVIINAFTVSYINDLPLVVTWRACCNRHWKVAIASSFSLISGLIPTAAANMFYVDGNDWMAVWQLYFWPLITYMCCLLVYLLCMIPDESRYMPRDLETVADHMALFSQSSLLEGSKFELQYELGKPVLEPQRKSPIVRVSILAMIVSIPSIFRTMWSSIKVAVIGPPELETRVSAKLSELSDDRLPKFGIWNRERLESGVRKRSWVVTIDFDADKDDEKTATLFEDDYYRMKWSEVWKRLKENLF